MLFFSTKYKREYRRTHYECGNAAQLFSSKKLKMAFQLAQLEDIKQSLAEDMRSIKSFKKAICYKIDNMLILE